MSRRIWNLGQRNAAAEVVAAVSPARRILASASRKRPCAKPRVFHSVHGDIGRPHLSSRCCSGSRWHLTHRRSCGNTAHQFAPGQRLAKYVLPRVDRPCHGRCPIDRWRGKRRPGCIPIHRFRARGARASNSGSTIFAPGRRRARRFEPTPRRTGFRRVRCTGPAAGLSTGGCRAGPRKPVSRHGAAGRETAEAGPAANVPRRPG